MKITTVRENTTTWEEIRNAIQYGTLQPGDKIEVKGCDWKVLAVEDGRILVWKCTGLEDHVFNENGSNVYEGSDIQKYLQEKFWKDLPGEMLQMVTDDGFFLLTKEQVLEYMPREIDRIATDEDDCTTWYWTASPLVGHGNTVRGIYPAGNVSVNVANYSYGVAPACWLQSPHL